MKATLHQAPTTASAMRIRFAAEAPANTEVFARFSDPRAMVAAGESVALDLKSLTPPSAIDGIEIIRLNDDTGDTAAMPLWNDKPIVVKGDWGGIRWQPGRAVVIASERDCIALLPALIAFAFYEGELRKLELAVTPFEAAADADVSHAYQMDTANRRHWDRLYRSMEQLYRLRLQFARLEPCLDEPPLSLPIEGRRLFARLTARSRISHRLESLSNRLETCEDLYEGACDRITDFKASQKGTLLEIAIVILLALEVILLLVQAHPGR